MPLAFSLGNGAVMSYRSTPSDPTTGPLPLGSCACVRVVRKNCAVYSRLLARKGAQAVTFGHRVDQMVATKTCFSPNIFLSIVILQIFFP